MFPKLKRVRSLILYTYLCFFSSDFFYCLLYNSSFTSSSGLWSIDDGNDRFLIEIFNISKGCHQNPLKLFELISMTFRWMLKIDSILK